MNSYAFLSYQTSDKAIAGKVKRLLATVKIGAFLAHEDIEVSEEWRLKIIEEIGKANIFICLISKNYLKSHWCDQESGIAVFRPEMTVVPLSIDGTNPTGFASSIQAVRVDPNNITLRHLLPAFLKNDFNAGIQIAIEILGRSHTFRSAEENFLFILPHLSRMSDAQIKLLLHRSSTNDQIYDATLCAKDYLPPILKSHGRFLASKMRSFLTRNCARYK